MSVTAASPQAREAFPRAAIVAVGALLAVTVAGTAAVRMSRLATPAAAPVFPPVATEASLRFADRADGAVTVSDARTGATVSTLAPDSNGFVRGVMRGLARDRLSRGLDAGPPFRLGRDAQGRMWLQDTATGRLVDLQAFGVDNRAAFAAFLPAGSPRP